MHYPVDPNKQKTVQTRPPPHSYLAGLIQADVERVRENYRDLTYFTQLAEQASKLIFAPSLKTSKNKEIARSFQGFFGTRALVTLELLLMAHFMVLFCDMHLKYEASLQHMMRFYVP